MPLCLKISSREAVNTADAKMRPVKRAHKISSALSCICFLLIFWSHTVPELMENYQIFAFLHTLRLRRSLMQKHPVPGVQRALLPLCKLTLRKQTQMSLLCIAGCRAARFPLFQHHALKYTCTIPAQCEVTPLFGIYHFTIYSIVFTIYCSLYSLFAK